jgi:hypothetical protein
MLVKEALKITEGFTTYKQNAGPELQPASLGVQNRVEASAR